MRQAVNNLQSTYSGFGFVGASEVFKVCDQPHPLKVQQLIKDCIKTDVDAAMLKLEDLWNYGYSAVDIVSTLFRVVKGMDALQEKLKLEFIRVRIRVFFFFLSFVRLCSTITTPSLTTRPCHFVSVFACAPQEIGFTHMKILEGVSTVVQLGGLIARLCRISMNPALFDLSRR